MVIERIKTLLKEEGNGHQKNFAARVGIPYTTFNNIINSNTSVSLENLEAILRVFPELNANWLILGIGEQWIKSQNLDLKTNNEKMQVANGNVGIVEQHQHVVTKETSMYERLLEKQEQLIESQKSELQLYKKRVEELEARIERLVKAR